MLPDAPRVGDLRPLEYLASAFSGRPTSVDTMLPREGKGILPGVSMQRYQHPVWRAMEGAGLAWGARTPRGPRAAERPARGLGRRPSSRRIPAGAGFFFWPVCHRAAQGPGVLYNTVQFAPGRFAPPLPAFKSKPGKPRIAVPTFVL